MPYSMTGFGQAKAKHDKRECLVELRSVNHRYLDISVRLPGNLMAYESDIKLLLSQKLRRGKVNVYVGFNGGADTEMELDTVRLKRYVSALRKAGKHLKLDTKLSVSDVASLPNVFQPAVDSVSLSRRWVFAKRVLEQAVGTMLKMRVREGERLTSDIRQRLRCIGRASRTIEQRAQQMPALYQKRVTQRVAELSGGLALSQETLAKEVALMAERADITEELVRLRHHLSFFEKTLKESGEVGKRLDFIAQEIQREANTIASKAGDFPVAEQVISIKTELEKIREQIQNIE